jgi:hypothetical protein
VILRDLESKFDVESPLEDLNEETRQAIADATAFDIRDTNRNFRYDYSAYERIVRNFTHMTKQGMLAEAMELALDLMKRGSYQVEMSDEGMMIDELEDCLRVVVRAVDSSSLAVKDKVSWIDKLRLLDRTKYLLTKELHRQYR